MYIYNVNFYSKDNKRINKIYFKTPEETYKQIFYDNGSINSVEFYINKLYSKNNIQFLVNKKSNNFVILSINIEFANKIFSSNKEIYDIFGKGQIYVSNSLKHLERKICTLYNLETYHNKYEPLIIFGLYSKEDLSIIYSHQSKVFILWGGSDCLYDNKILKVVKKLDKIKRIKHLSISEYIYKKLTEWNFKYITEIFLTFCIGDSKYIPYKTKKNLIFVYDSIGSYSEKKNSIYNIDLVDSVENESDTPFWRTSKNKFIENVINIYKRCNLGLRLTKYDGNANTCQEMGLMNIPVICNISMNHCIPWKSKVDILFKINYIINNNIKIEYKWVKPKILIISGDLPNNGGAATHTFYLNKYLNNHGFDSNAIFLNEEQKSLAEYSDNNLYKNIEIINDEKYSTRLVKYVIKNSRYKKYDKIILRTSLNTNCLKKVKEYTRELLYFVPGIFKNNLNVDPFDKLDSNYWLELEVINLSNLNTMKYCDKVFLNSPLTKSVVEHYQVRQGIKNLNLFYFITLKKYEIVEELPKWEDREYDLIFITNNMNREIKNTPLVIEIYKQYPNLKKILVGDGNFEEEIPNLTYYPRLPDLKIFDLLKNTKILINTSFFDSFSNVVWNGVRAGCNVVVSRNNGISHFLDDLSVVLDYKLENWQNIINKNLVSFIDSNKRKLEELQWSSEILIQKILSD